MKTNASTPMMEPVEPRRMMSATSMIAGNALIVYGTEGDDMIVVASETKMTHVRSGLRYDKIITVDDGSTIREFSATGISSLTVKALGGHDLISCSDAKVPALIDGGSGPDFILGTDFADLIYTGADSVSDWVIANGGDDVIIDEGVTWKNDAYDGGAGYDTIYYNPQCGPADDDIVDVEHFVIKPWPK